MSDFFSPGQARLIANFLLGGAGVGIAGAGLVSMAQDVKDKIRDANPDTGSDDDVVYVDVPGKPPAVKPEQKKIAATVEPVTVPPSGQYVLPEDLALPPHEQFKIALTRAEAAGESPNSALFEKLRKQYAEVEAMSKAAGFLGGLATPGVALAGGTVASIEAYRALRSLYLKRKQEKLQKEVDDAQHIVLGPEVGPGGGVLEKAAGEGPLSMTDAAMLGIPVGIPLLLAYASHKVSREALRKTFPQLQPPSEKPTRVVLRTRQTPSAEVLPSPPEKEEEKPETLALKSAMLNEFLIDTACALDPDNAVGLIGLVKAAACGQYAVLCASARDSLSLDDAFDNIGSKYASVNVSPANYRAGLRLVAECPVLSPSVTLLSAAHVTDSTPTFGAMSKAASEDMPAWDDMMDKVAMAYIGDVRRAAFADLVALSDEHAKSASDLGMPDASSILSLLAGGLGGQESVSDPVTAAKGRDSTDAGDNRSGPELLAGDVQAGTLIKKKKDIVDAILEAARQPAKAQPGA